MSVATDMPDVAKKLKRIVANAGKEISRKERELLFDLVDEIVAKYVLDEPKFKTKSLKQVRRELETNRIKEVRKKRGLTQVALAKKMNATQAFISKLEKKDYNPTVRKLRKVAAALDVAPSELI